MTELLKRGFTVDQYFSDKYQTMYEKQGRYNPQVITIIIYSHITERYSIHNKIRKINAEYKYFKSLLKFIDNGGL